MMKGSDSLEEFPHGFSLHRFDSFLLDKFEPGERILRFESAAEEMQSVDVIGSHDVDARCCEYQTHQYYQQRDQHKLLVARNQVSNRLTLSVLTSNAI